MTFALEAQFVGRDLAQLGSDANSGSPQSEGRSRKAMRPRRGPPRFSRQAVSTLRCQQPDLHEHFSKNVAEAYTEIWASNTLCIIS